MACLFIIDDGWDAGCYLITDELFDKLEDDNDMGPFDEKGNIRDGVISENYVQHGVTEEVHYREHINRIRIVHG